VSELSKNKIKWLRSLSLKKNRDEEGLFILEGEKMVSEAIAQRPDLIQMVAHVESYKLPVSSLNCEIHTISEKELEQLSELRTPNKVLAVLRKPKLNPINQSGLIIALSDVQDPGNLGTILRIADWYGISDVVCSMNTVDCFNQKVLQSCMGAILRINISYVDLKSFLSTSKSTIYGALLEGENIYGINSLPDGILLMGNEGKGISDELIPLITSKISIPRFGQAESLNVSVATGILVSEFFRKK
jgi:TrmH family RNA methyltransferase